MDYTRTLDAYCAHCETPAQHTPIDAGSCQCVDCGRVELMVLA